MTMDKHDSFSVIMSKSARIFVESSKPFNKSKLHPAMSMYQDRVPQSRTAENLVMAKQSSQAQQCNYREQTNFISKYLQAR